MSEKPPVATSAPISNFGERFVAEAIRLGVPLSAGQVERLGKASRGQIMCAVEKRLPLLNRELLRAIGRRGPEALARELSVSGRPEEGLLSGAMSIIDAGYLFEFLADGVDDAVSAIDSL